MSIKRIIDWEIEKAEGDKIGTIASPFAQISDGTNWLWAADVDVGEPEVLRKVPVASNNREIIYAEVGKPVALKRMGDGKWVIAGLAKTSRGMGHIIYISFEEDLAYIVSKSWIGAIIRQLTYGELGTLLGGYGTLPYGVYGRFAANGSLIEIMETY
jgi:hypothetical protein